MNDRWDKYSELNEAFLKYLVCNAFRFMEDAKIEHIFLVATIQFPWIFISHRNTSLSSYLRISTDTLIPDNLAII